MKEPRDNNKVYAVVLLISQKYFIIFCTILLQNDMPLGLILSPWEASMHILIIGLN